MFDMHGFRPFWLIVLLGYIAIPVGLFIRIRRLKEAKKADDKKYRELESFNYTVAHDLRSPLLAIGGFSSLLKQTYGAVLEEKGLRYLTKIQDASERMAHLIDDLLKLAKVSQGGIEREDTDLCHLARSAAMDLEMVYPDRRVEFKLAVPEARVKCDSRLVRIALDNLIGNAWKFTKNRERAFVEFGAHHNNGSKVFYVRDNGVGFDPTHKGKLFRPFERLHSSHDFEGTGIGLITVHRIIERHRGTIWADSKIDHGAVFYFTLPES